MVLLIQCNRNGSETDPSRWQFGHNNDYY